MFMAHLDSSNCVSWRIWTFTANSDQRIQISFQYFHLYEPEYLEIGDGLENGEETRLAHFIGDSLPSNVVSVSNSAWIYVEAPPGTTTVNAEVVVRAVNRTGTVLSFEDYLYSSI